MRRDEIPNWDNEINELEIFFAGKQLPEKVRINSWSLVVNTRLFLDSHFATIRRHNGKDIYKPYLERLQQLKNTIENGTL